MIKVLPELLTDVECNARDQSTIVQWYASKILLGPIEGLEAKLGADEVEAGIIVQLGLDTTAGCFQWDA